MQIRRFYSPDLTLDSRQIILPDSETVHALRVLRLRPGDSMLLMNGKGLTADAELSAESTNHKAICLIKRVQEFQPPNPRLVLYVAPPHTKVFDLILKSAVELGTTKIVPIITKYSTAKPDDKPDAWQNILVTAMKQAINPFLPEITRPMEFSAALNTCPTNGVFGATPREGQTQNTRKKITSDHIAVWIGPEGGFDTEEEIALLDKGMTPITLGNYVLRVETAVPAMLAACLINI